MRNLYYVYDSAAGNYMYFCEAPADAVAIRAFRYACENEFKISAPDLSLYKLGELNDYSITPTHTLIYRYTASMAERSSEDEKLA